MLAGSSTQRAMVADQLLVGCERIVDDRAKPSAFADRGHPATQRAFIADKIRELSACARTGFVDHAKIPVEENASVFCVVQDSLPVFRICNRVLLDDLLW